MNQAVSPISKQSFPGALPAMVVFLCIVISVAAQVTLAQQSSGVTKVKGEGVSDYRPNAITTSYNKALEAAQRNAVEQASGVFIQSRSEMRNFELVKDEVLSRSQGFIKSFKVLKKGRDGDLYKVSIEAEVEKAAFIKDIDASLEVLYRRIGRPRIMVVIKEKTLDVEGFEKEGQVSQDIAEKEIRKILNKQGFTFIDARSAAGISLLAVALKGDEIVRSQVIEAARTTKAEIIILGSAHLQSKGAYGPMNIMQANISLDVVQVDSGQVLASEIASGRGLEVSKNTAAAIALQKAAREITPKMIQQVTYHWIKSRQEGNRIELIVKNASFRDWLVLKRTLGGQISGVKKVIPRSYRKRVALLELMARNSAEEIAESLVEVNFGKFTLEIEDVTSKKLTVSVVKK